MFDLPQIVLPVVADLLEHRRCGCGQVTMAGAIDGVPAGVGTPTQYGPDVRSLAGWYLDGATGLDPFLDAVTAGLQAAPVLGADETGIRADGPPAWVHAARTDGLTLYTVSPRRGVEALREAGVLGALSADGVLVHAFMAVPPSAADDLVDQVRLPLASSERWRTGVALRDSYRHPGAAWRLGNGGWWRA